MAGNMIEEVDLLKAQEEYKKSNEKGVFIISFKKMLNEYFKEYAKTIIEAIYILEPNIDNKADIIQKVIVNRYFLSKLLKYRYDNNVNISFEIVSCNIMLPDNNWLGRCKELVLPTVIKDL